MLKEDGKEKVFARHKSLREELRNGLRELGLELVVDDQAASPSITSIYPPQGMSVDEIRKSLKENFKIVVADGQEELKGKIFRIGHMGYVFHRDIGMTLHALKTILKDKSATTSEKALTANK